MKIKEDCGHGSEDRKAHSEWSEKEEVPLKRLRGLGSSDGSGRCDVSNCGIGNNGLVENHKRPAERPSLTMLSKTTIPHKLDSKQSSRM